MAAKGYTPSQWPDGETVRPTPAQMRNIEQGIKDLSEAPLAEVAPVEKGDAVDDATSAASVITQFNKLLASLRASGVISK